jgi:hypothetical protein
MTPYAGLYLAHYHKSNFTHIIRPLHCDREISSNQLLSLVSFIFAVAASHPPSQASKHAVTSKKEIEASQPSQAKPSLTTPVVPHPEQFSIHLSIIHLAMFEDSEKARTE